MSCSDCVRITDKSIYNLVNLKYLSCGNCAEITDTNIGKIMETDCYGYPSITRLNPTYDNYPNNDNSDVDIFELYKNDLWYL